MHDLIVKGGRIVDGSGMPSYVGDMAVKDGRIVEVGRVSGGAARAIDATGLVVAPGFIDIHTHYDAQAFWDPLITPSSWNGVTTVVMGNCGFTLAPCRPSDQEYLTNVLAGVEAISAAAISKGVPFNWDTFPTFLEAMDTPRGINVACNVGHSAVRRFVMGQRATEAQATEDEVRQMGAVVRQALEAGAFCFTTSRSVTHWGPNGEPVPSRVGTEEEVYHLASQVKGLWNCGLEMVGLSNSHSGREFMTKMSRDFGCQLNWNEWNIVGATPDSWRKIHDYMAEANRAGAQIYGISRCQQSNMEFDLRDNTILLAPFTGWADVLAKPLQEKKRLLATPEVRERLKAGIDRPPRGLGFSWRKTAIWEAGLEKNRKMEGQRLGELAEAAGKHPVDIMFDLAVEEDLRTEFALVDFTYIDKENTGAMLKSPYSILGISDGGAHLNTFCGAMYPTFFLSKWVREWRIFTMEEAIRKMTFVPAALLGFLDRGLLRPGMAADVTIFNPATVGPGPTRKVNDLPGGDSRIVISADGVTHGIVGGQVVFQGGRPTGALPGRLIRSSAYRG